MFGTTFWVALGLFILLAMAWYYGRGAILAALTSRIRGIEQRVNDVKEVLEAAKTLHDETKQRHVELEQNLQQIEKNAVEEAQILCEERARLFKARMLHKEKQIDTRIAMERGQMEDDLRVALLSLALQEVEECLAGRRGAGLDEKSQTAKAMANLSKLFSGES